MRDEEGMEKERRIRERDERRERDNEYYEDDQDQDANDGLNGSDNETEFQSNRPHDNGNSILKNHQRENFIPYKPQIRNDSDTNNEYYQERDRSRSKSRVE